MTFKSKRKSKKYNKRNRCKVTRKKKGKTRKRMTKRGGMKSARIVNTNATTPLEKRIKTEEELELERLEDSLESIRNQKLGIQSAADIPNCVIGPDYSQSPEYIALRTVYGARFEAEKNQKATKGKATKGKATKGKAIDASYEAFKNIEKMIRQRLGQVRCEAGPYRIFEFPRYKESSLLEQNIRLKFVVVKDENNKFMILMSYANMPNINYVEENLLKWTDKTPDGSIIPRTNIQGPKKVIEITSDIIKDIEKFCRENGISLRWDSLLMTKSMNSDSYNNIIQRYFGERMSPYKLQNTVFIMRIDEISHSALANNFRDKPIQKDRSGIHLVYLGCEGVIYYKNGKLYFIICNLSGHFKTPAERMAYLRLILKYNYGYNEDEIRELFPDAPPQPQAQASDSDSDGSDDDDSLRPDFRRFLTNDPDIQTFAQALIRLNQADITPRQGPVHTPYSQEVPI
jgi:hypothetical protein